MNLSYKDICVMSNTHVYVQVHLRSALRLREMCSRNGGLFIKVGQHIGALEYMLPKEYVQTFQLFHSEAPQTPLDRLIRVVEEELGRPCEFIHRHPLYALLTRTVCLRS